MARLTPQVFPLNVLLRAHAGPAGRSGGYRRGHGGGTERWSPRLVPGHADNIKITVPGDLVLAEFYLREQGRERVIRIGHGYDVHPLVAGRALILGGVSIPHDKGLAGYSDGMR